MHPRFPEHLYFTRPTNRLQTLKLNDIPLDPDLIVEAGYTSHQDEAHIKELLSLPTPPTALFCGQQLYRAGRLRALRAKGLQVPGDMSVACFNDLGEESAIDPFLTVASQPAYQFGSMGIQLLINRIKDRADEDRQTIILPSALRIRSSTASCDSP